MEKESVALSNLKSGTGFMIGLSETIPKLMNIGYTENLVPCFDHLSCRTEKIQLYPKDLHVDAIIRFENDSDPDDLSLEMLECLNDHT